MRPAAQVPADQQGKVRKQQNMRMGQKIYVNQPQIRFPTQDKKIVSRYILTVDFICQFLLNMKKFSPFLEGELISILDKNCP